jgi:hypothetical protein
MADAGICPLPNPPLDAAFVTWTREKPFHHIHPKIYGAAQFSPQPKGNARFSTILDAAGAVIPTIYGGTTFDCAAMETVFRDVPFVPDRKIVWKARLMSQEHSVVMP